MSITMTINGASVTINSQAILNRNRKENADFGSLNIVNTRTTRYEPYTKCVVNGEQYLIESDNPLLLKDDLWEHEITLAENISILKTVFPVDRSFKRVPALSIKEILNIYKKELEFYHGFMFYFDDTDTIYDTKMVDKEYAGQSFAVIVYDLFRKINAIPRLTWQNSQWYISYELYTKTNSLLTLAVEHKQENVNDIDYATEIMFKSRNAVNENQGLWFPNKTNWVKPRSKSTMLRTSDLQYELDSDIKVIYQALAKLPVQYVTYVGQTPTTNDIDLIVDFTQGVITETEYNNLELHGNYSNYSPKIKDTEDELEFYKENAVYYNIDKNVIQGLFWSANTAIGFTANILALFNTIEQFVYISASEQITNFNKENLTFLSYDIYDIECRFYYQPKRDVDFIAEKHNITGFNKSTILNNQKDTMIELGQFLNNANVIINRIGNQVVNLTQTFDTWAARWQLGDYFVLNTQRWVIVDVKYTVDKTLVSCNADFAVNFSNIDRETSVSREPSPYVYTGKGLQSNFIYREYLVLSDETITLPNDSNLSTTAKRIAMNIFDYDEQYNEPIQNLIYLRSAKYIDMPLFKSAGGNVALLHGAFKDARYAGFGLIKKNDAWYKSPVYYVKDDYSLDDIYIKLNNSFTEKTDTDNYKWYPEVSSPTSDYMDNFVLMPVDKDPNDILALTYQFVAVSLQEDIIINNLMKFCNLIKEFSTAPTLTLYSSTTPYTIFDNLPRGTLVTGGIITLYDTYIEITDALGDPIEYWSIVADGEIILSGNNDVEKVYYQFSKTRGVYEVEDMIAFDIEYNLSLSLAATYSIPIKIKQAAMELEFSLTADYLILDIFMMGASMNISFDLEATYRIGVYEWIETTVSVFNAGSVKHYNYRDIQPTPLPAVEDYQDVLKITIYDLQSSNVVDYNEAGTQITITDSSVFGVANGEAAEDVLEDNNANAFTSLSTGVMTDTVIKITDGNLDVTYWKPDYTYYYYIVDLD